jgi:DNA-binding PucR family transcriptional regulator
VVVSSGRETDLVDALGDACKRFDCVGAYAIADSPGVVATTFAALKPVAVVAARCARHLGPAFDLDAAMPFLLASRVPPRTQDHLVGKHLGPLLRGTNAKHARKQIATLEAWYAADHKTQDAAAALHVGVQGLRARMRRIQELTGLDPRHHRLSFEVAIALYRLFEDEWEAPGGPRWNGDAF